VRAIFERITIDGEHVAGEQLTPWALSHGLATALPATVVEMTS
jgi:hypothetical protein